VPVIYKRNAPLFLGNVNTKTQSLPPHSVPAPRGNVCLMQDVIFDGQLECPSPTQATNRFAYFRAVSSLNYSVTEFQDLKLDRVLLAF
jgi:hypothetical protein